MNPGYLVFSDLDGTLLDAADYSFRAAAEALVLLARLSVPLVLVSSKTRAEIEVWRKRLGNSAPFVSENGGGVFVPAGDAPVPDGSVAAGEYGMIVLGARYALLREELARLRDGTGIPVRGFGDMTVGEVAELTGLPAAEASLAKMREFDEPFVFDGAPDRRFLDAVEGRGLRWTRGRLYHLMGESDKGRGVRLLKNWYAGRFGHLATVALGDSLNDLPMLREVDHPVLVRRKDGGYDQDVDLPGLFRTEGIGPAGWNEAILTLVASGGAA